MTYEQILTEEFLNRQETSLIPALDDYLQKSPLSKAKRVEELLNLLKKGLSFGLKKGEHIQKLTQEKVKRANKDIERKWCSNFISMINDAIQADIESKKNKRSKKKK